MPRRKATSVRRKRAVVGRGGVISTVLNKAIDLLPFEAHVPGYRFCGPGTRLQKRLDRGDKGVNPLDEACKIHDIAYSRYSDSEHRRAADKELAERAWQRFKSADASLGEKATAWTVTTAMKAKTAIGGGCKRRKRKTNKGRKRPTRSSDGKGLYLRPYKGGGKKKSKRTVKKKTCLSGKGSVISCELFPSFDASSGDYEIGLVDLSTFNSIPNIERGKNDKFYYGSDKSITFEEGAYEVEDVNNYIKDRMEKNVKFQLKANNNTLRTIITCNQRVDFTKPDSIGPLLGFSRKVLEPSSSPHTSDLPVNIIKVSTIRVECNIARGSFDNGIESHVIHEFYPEVEPGYKINVVPNTIIYLPVTAQRVNNITVLLRDQDGNLVNFRGEIVSLRLHIRRRRLDHGFSI